MAITRTIYTQGKVTLKTGSIGGTLGNFAIVSGVQNATFSLNTPRENVNSFGFKGLVDKVQVAPETATATFSYILPKNDIETDAYLTNANHLSPSKISGLMGDAASDTHSGVHVELAGLGTLMSGVLNSFNINAAVGELATVEMTFQGVPSGTASTDATLPDKNSTIGTANYDVLTPDRISGYLPDNTLGNDTGNNPDLIDVPYVSDFTSTADSFTYAAGTLTANQSVTNYGGGWLKISNASSQAIELSRTLSGATNGNNYVISFYVSNGTGATIYVSASLDSTGGSSDEYSPSIMMLDGETKIITFSNKAFVTNDILYIKFANGAGSGTTGPTGNMDLSTTFIFIKNVIVSTDGGTNNAGNFGGCVRSATFSWEMPIETVQCLGESVSQSYRFSNPPGTSSLVLEGIDVPYPVSGLTLGDMRVYLQNAKVVSREHNMAVGEVSSTYNLTIEATALDALMVPTLTSN